MQPARHYFAAVVRSQGQAAAGLPKEGARAARGKQESHHGPRDPLLIRVLHAYHGFFRARRTDVIDGAVAFQNHQVQGAVLPR